MQRRNFQHLANMQKPAAIVVGDGRLKVAESTQIYDLIVLDAFSSDAIPLHLLTIEALQDVFLPHLSEQGTIAYHITNQYVDLEGPLERLANATGLDGLVKHDRPSNSEMLPFSTATDWVALTRNPTISQALRGDGWQSMKVGTMAWSDDFTNLYGSLKRNVKRA
jgi:spermidine synthase